MAKIADLLAAGRTFSFEFFPPKNDNERTTLVQTLRELEPLGPSFVSVTYRGGRASRRPTLDLVSGMLRTTTLTPMAHLTCVAHDRLELAEVLVELRRAGVENLMALGGDPIRTDDAIEPELIHAIELVELAHAIGGFSIGVAAHPTVHPNSPDRDTDRQHLASKLRLGDFAITQFFHRADDYFPLIDELAALGVDKPVIPGIMPVTAAASIPRMAEMGGPVPDDIAARFAALSDKDDQRKLGIELATRLCQDLLDGGAPGLHFYTLNRSTATREIYANLGLTQAA
jgi:methylenetetrahydrofolate reductase (NADPH)